jgi:hypothetical protein
MTITRLNCLPKNVKAEVDVMPTIVLASTTLLNHGL